MDRHAVGWKMILALVWLFAIATVVGLWFLLGTNDATRQSTVNADVIRQALDETSFYIIEGSLEINDTLLEFRLQRSAGGDNVSGVFFVIEDAEGQTQAVSEYEEKSIEVLQSESVSVSLFNISSPVKKITLYPLYHDATVGKIRSLKPLVLYTNWQLEN